MEKTYATKAGDIQRRWWVIDAEGQTLGRLVARITPYLTGKNKPLYTPQLDCGDFVIVINCEKIAVTGNRLDDKFYYRHSGYHSGLTTTSLRDQLTRHPERVIEDAVWGMLPKGKLGRQIYKKLKAYKGSQHPHEAQKPEVLKF